MQDFSTERKDIDVFIADLVKKVSAENKMRVADILTGVVIAEQALEEEKPRYADGFASSLTRHGRGVGKP